MREVCHGLLWTDNVSAFNSDVCTDQCNIALYKAGCCTPAVPSCRQLYLTESEYTYQHFMHVTGKVALDLNKKALCHEGVRVSRGMYPRLLELGISWRWLVIFTPLPLYPRGDGPGTHWIGGWVRSRAGLEWRGEEKILDATGTRTPTPRSSSLQLVSILTPQFIDVTMTKVFLGGSFFSFCYVFIHILFNDAFSSSDYDMTWNGGRIMNWKGYGRKCSSPNFRYYHGIFLEGLGKPKSEYDNPCLVRNPITHEWEVGATNPTSSQVCKFYYMCCKTNRVYDYC
jgi:hypothetical protein